MPGLISPQKLEEIRAANDIVDVISGYLGPLKRAGANFVTLCPFHREKSPSFNINPGRQIFHCFGCHKGGDVFTFVKEHESLSFVEAARRLAERGRITLEFEDDPAGRQQRGLKERLLEIHEQVTGRWQMALANDAAGQIARDYLARRGVGEEAVKLFRLGYAPDAWDDTVNWARGKNHDLAVVEQGGLIIRRDKSDGFYDRFRGRLIFPICDEQARVIGFSGRVLAGDEKTAKYVNSPETPIFTKGKVIYGLDKSKRALADLDHAIICEGQLDLIACFMAGVRNVVAPQGTALTADHARILKRYVDEVVLCFDSDNAGQNAAVRSLDALLASGLAIRVATVPLPHDPDTFIKANGGDAFRELIGRAEGFFEYHLNRLCATNDLATDRGRLAVLQAMAAAAYKTGNQMVIDRCAQLTAARLGTGVIQGLKAFHDARPRQGMAPDSEAMPEPESPAADLPPATELWLLRLLFQSDDQMDWLAATLDLDWLTSPSVREIISRRVAVHTANTWTGAAPFLSGVENEALRQLATEAITASDTLFGAAAAADAPGHLRHRHEERAQLRPASLRDTLIRLRNQFIDRQLPSLDQRLHTPGISEEEQITLLREREALRRLKQTSLPGAAV